MKQLALLFSLPFLHKRPRTLTSRSQSKEISGHNLAMFPTPFHMIVSIFCEFPPVVPVGTFRNFFRSLTIFGTSLGRGGRIPYRINVHLKLPSGLIK